MTITSTSAPLNLVYRQTPDLALGAVGEEFFKSILDMSMADALITDDSELSDFSFGGEHSISDDPSRTLEQEYQLWDAWVLDKIKSTFSLELESTKISLVSLCAMLEARSNPAQFLH